MVANSFTEAMIFDALTGQQIGRLKTGVGNGWGVEYSPDGRTIAVSGWTEDGTANDTAVTIWDAKTRRLIQTVRQPYGFKLLTFSPDGTRLAATEDKDDTTIIDVRTGKALQTLAGHTGGSHRPAFSPDGRYLAVACGPLYTENQGSIKIWDVSARRIVHTLEGHTKIVWGVAYSPDGNRLASCSFDQKVKIWDPSTGQEALTLHGHTNTVPAVAFSPDGWRLASASEDGTIRIWDASPITEPPARELLTLTGHTDEVRSVAFSPDGRWLASAGDDMILRLWSATSGRLVHSLRKHTHPVSGLAFSPDGRRMVSGDHDGTMVAWDVEAGTLVLELRKGVKETGPIMGIAYSPDGLNFATAGVNGIDKWDATTGTKLKSIALNDWQTFCLAYSHDGRLIISGSRDSTVNVSDLSTGRLIKTLGPYAGRISAVAFDPEDKDAAAASSDGAISFWETSNWRAAGSIAAHKGPALALAYSRRRQTTRFGWRGSDDQSLGSGDPP